MIKRLKTLALFFLGIILIGIANSLPIIRSKEVFAFLLPPQDMQHLALGYNEIIADSLWIRLIQDIGQCETVKIEESYLAALTKHEKFNQDGVNACDKGWSYQMLNAITSLAPKFRAAYIFGGTALSVISNDIEGARLLYDRAVKEFPNDWKLNYYAAYHYLWEIKNYERAAELLVAAGNSGAPKWVYSLAGKLYSKVGQAIFAKTVLEAALEGWKDQDERFKKRIEERLSEVNSQLDRAEKEEPSGAGSP